MKAATGDVVNILSGQGCDGASSEVPTSVQQKLRSTARKGRVVTTDPSVKIAPPAINRPLRKTCSRCATCGAMRCAKPKRR